VVTCGYMWLQVHYVQPKKVGFRVAVPVLATRIREFLHDTLPLMHEASVSHFPAW